MKYILNYKIFEVSVKKSEKIDLYRDDKYIVVSPLTYNASCKYGAFTKWCISVPHAEYVWDSAPNAKIVFIIQKKYHISDDNNEKISRFLYLKDKNDDGDISESEIEEYNELSTSHDIEDLSKIAIVQNTANNKVEIWDANNINLDDKYSTIEDLPIDYKVIKIVWDYIYMDYKTFENTNTEQIKNIQLLQQMSLTNNIKVCKEQNIPIINGEYISLYHGTTAANFKKILKSNKLNSGTFFTPDYEIANKYAKSVTNGKSNVNLYVISLKDLTYNGYYWIALSDLYYHNSVYSSKY